MSGGVICVDCLDGYDAAGESYMTKRVAVVTISEGTARCVEHHRAYRDRNKEVDARNFAAWKGDQ